jgi:hypothetical protein
MVMRRLIGLLTSLLLFHLTLVGADLTCAKHGAHATAHVSQPATPAHTDHHASPPLDAPGDDDMSCRVPTLPACCQALVSCGLSIDEARSTASDGLSHLALDVLSGADDAPTSWTLEPDPPPPKA